MVFNPSIAALDWEEAYTCVVRAIKKSFEKIQQLLLVKKHHSKFHWQGNFRKIEIIQCK
jgi:hypothetical protein